MPVWLQNLIWIMEAPRTIDSDDTVSSIRALFYFSPMVDRWLDASREVDPAERRAVIQRTYDIFRSIAHWSELTAPGGLMPIWVVGQFGPEVA